MLVSGKSERRAARVVVADYHQAQLGELVARVGEAVDRYRAGEKRRAASMSDHAAERLIRRTVRAGRATLDAEGVLLRPWSPRGQCCRSEQEAARKTGWRAATGAAVSHSAGGVASRRTSRFRPCPLRAAT